MSWPSRRGAQGRPGEGVPGEVPLCQRGVVYWQGPGEGRRVPNHAKSADISLMPLRSAPTARSGSSVSTCRADAREGDPPHRVTRRNLHGGRPQRPAGVPPARRQCSQRVSPAASRWPNPTVRRFGIVAFRGESDAFASRIPRSRVMPLLRKYTGPATHESAVAA